MELIFLSIVTIIFFIIRTVVFQYILKRHPGVMKYIGYYLLTVCTGIFIYFPSCILLGNEVCGDYDVATHKTVLLIASSIILLLCGWVWVEIFKYPEINNESRVPGTSRVLGIILIIMAVVVGSIFVILGTSSYWAPWVGH